MEPVAVPRPRSPYASYNADPEPLVGEETALIRPFILAWERMQATQREQAVERSAQQDRRAILDAALDGFDIGPDMIHGVRLPVTA
ncbi:hypothetical protein AB0C52_29100 [Streptomyces sp. NPDC048717]|uniref:hypothetical protein n=1 Tax=Streptomyces sp. NPDC048717 TaxID=3154928 RepID=UPI00342B4D51